MHLTLPESSHRRPRAAGGTFLSALLHAAVIAATVAGTAISAPRSVTRDTLEKLVFVKTLPKEPPARHVAPHVQQVRPPIGTPPVVPFPDIVPPALRIDPTVVPTTIPDVSTPLGAELEGRTVAGTSNSATEGASGAASAGGADGAPLSALAVDEEVVVRSAATPRYPSMLASAGIEGVVLARFVVDTLGRVERGSVEISSDSHELFARSVREALERTRFEPARVRGRKVRQLVQQPFTFAITRR